jgi:hypothetical protein
LLYTLNLIQTKSLRQSVSTIKIVSNKKVAIMENLSHSLVRGIYHSNAIFSQMHSLWKQGGDIMRYCSNGFTKRQSNIPLWYMWKLCSYTLLLADQMTFIDLHIQVFDLFHILHLNINCNIYCVSFKSLITWNSQVDCDTTDYASIFHRSITPITMVASVLINKSNLNFPSSSLINIIKQGTV